MFCYSETMFFTKVVFFSIPTPSITVKYCSLRAVAILNCCCFDKYHFIQRKRSRVAQKGRVLLLIVVAP